MRDSEGKDPIIERYRAHIDYDTEFEKVEVSSIKREHRRHEHQFEESEKNLE
jgi:hypothetical protein